MDACRNAALHAGSASLHLRRIVHLVLLAQSVSGDGLVLVHSPTTASLVRNSGRALEVATKLAVALLLLLLCHVLSPIQVVSVQCQAKQVDAGHCVDAQQNTCHVSRRIGIR